MPHPTAPPPSSPPRRTEPAIASVTLDDPGGLAVMRVLRASWVFFLTRHLPLEAVQRLQSSMAAASAELGSRVIFHPWEHERDGDAYAIKAITSRVWAQPAAPLALIFIDRPGSPTRSPDHLCTAFGFLARDALAQMDGLESMGITEHALVAYTSLPPPTPPTATDSFAPAPPGAWVESATPTPPARRRILSFARQKWTCSVHAAPDELAAVTVNATAHPVLAIPPGTEVPAMEYLNNKAVVVFILPGVVVKVEAYELVRRALIEGAREWMMPTVFVPWSSGAGMQDTWTEVENIARAAHRRALRGGLVLAFLDPQSLVDGTVRLIHTARAPMGQVTGDVIITHGRIPAKDVASAVGGVGSGAARDIVLDLEYSGRVDYHRPPGPDSEDGDQDDDDDDDDPPDPPDGVPLDGSIVVTLYK